MIPSKFREYIGLASKRRVPETAPPPQPPLSLPRSCSVAPPGSALLTYREAELMRKQVLDWKLVEGEAGSALQLRRAPLHGCYRLCSSLFSRRFCLRRSWTAKDEAAGRELVTRLRATAKEEGEPPPLDGRRPWC